MNVEVRVLEREVRYDSEKMSERILEEFIRNSYPPKRDLYDNITIKAIVKDALNAMGID